MRLFNTFISVTLTVMAALPVGARPVIDSLLLELDRILPVREKYEGDRRASIAAGWDDFCHASTDSDRYAVLRGLHDAYSGYRIDSALMVADMRLAIARRLGDRGKIASASINLADSYSHVGEYAKALTILDTLSRTSLADYHRKYLYNVYYSTGSKLARTAVIDRERLSAIEAVKSWRDSILRYSPEGSRGYYVLNMERLQDAGMMREAVALMDEACRRYDFKGNAAVQYSLGMLLLNAGDRDAAKEALARSSLLDITSGTKEYASLIELACVLYDDGDLDRAFGYINCAFEDARFSKARFRTSEIMNLMPIIDSAFHEYEQESARHTRQQMLAIVLVAIVVICALAIVAMQLRRITAMSRRLGESNRVLESRNRRLAEADALKLRHVEDLLETYAGYIGKLKNYRKSLYRLMKTGQYDAVTAQLKSDRLEAGEMKEFYATFDRAFLSMFPDFITMLSGMFKEPLELKSEDTLTPELRVLAMMKLGFTSTSEIASMLHYTPQTVYNYRSTLRSMLRADWAELERHLGLDSPSAAL